jgi:hypothetical protein
MRLVSIVALVRWRGFLEKKKWCGGKGVFIGGFLKIVVFGRGVLVVKTWWDA